MRDWKRLMEKHESAGGKPMKTQLLAAELGKRLPSDAIVNCDPGTIATVAGLLPARRAASTDPLEALRDE